VKSKAIQGPPVVEQEQEEADRQEGLVVDTEAPLSETAIGDATVSDSDVEAEDEQDVETHLGGEEKIGKED